MFRETQGADGVCSGIRSRVMITTLCETIFRVLPGITYMAQQMANSGYYVVVILQHKDVCADMVGNIVPVARYNSSFYSLKSAIGMKSSSRKSCHLIAFWAICLENDSE